MLNKSHARPLAVLWDFGGVILTSPFEAFRIYEREAGLPEDFIRMLNARNADTNAWAKMERSEVSLEDFVTLFQDEAREQGQLLAVRGLEYPWVRELQPAEDETRVRVKLPAAAYISSQNAPHPGVSSCAPRSRINGCARCGARRFLRLRPPGCQNLSPPAPVTAP